MKGLPLTPLMLILLFACRDDSVNPDKRTKELLNTTWKLWSTDTVIWDGMNIQYLIRKIEQDSCYRTLSFFESNRCMIVDSCNGQSAESQSGYWVWYEGSGLITEFDHIDLETMYWRFLNYSPDT